MMNKLANVFHCNAENIGDRMCGPAQYLWPKLAQVLPVSKSLPLGVENIILGGGQIFSQLSKLSAENSGRPNPSKLLAWGVGLPVRGAKDGDVKTVSERFRLFSTRNFDWRDVLPFVPCASCLSNIFDTADLPIHEVVVFNHRRKPNANGVPESIPVMANSIADPISALRFIASGETVITSSYHGVYWAQLLGRRVICIPYNDKFRTFQHQPTFASPENWRHCIKQARKYEPLLGEYRFLNEMFARQVEQVWNE